MADARIRVLVVDDHPLFRQGLATIAQVKASNIEIVGQASNGYEALDLIRRTSPDVVTMDIQMRGMNGVEATRRIKQLFPSVRVLVLSTYDEEAYILDMLKAGADGYLLKESDGESILRAIEGVYHGEREVHPLVMRRLWSAFGGMLQAQQSKAAHGEEDGLSPREVEVLQLVAQGLTNKEVGARLSISERTVDNHLRNIYSKLDIHDRTQLVLYAVRRGLVPLQS